MTGLAGKNPSYRGLQEMGIELPQLPTTVTGGLPKTRELAAARSASRRGGLSRGILDEKAREATAFWIRTQEEIGLDVLGDGEQYRGDMVSYFAAHMKGFKEGGLVRCFGNRCYRKPVITGKVRWTSPITAGWWKYAQSLTSRPVKGVITGPYTMMDYSFNEHYSGRRAAVQALAREIRREAVSLVEAGCRIIQIDEPALTARPDDAQFAADALESVMEKLRAYFIVHVWYGALEPVWQEMLGIPAQNLGFEMSGRMPETLRLLAGRPFGRDVTVGVFAAGAGKAESPDAIGRRVKKAAETLDPDRVWIGPDCGLKALTVEEAVTRLNAMQEAVNETRKTL
jgi:5-methyltetrahydropteroyltriglutamate--homocysteine methyltransferase